MQTRAITINEIRDILYGYFNQSYYDEDGDITTQIYDILLGENNSIFCIYKTNGVYYQADISINQGMIELSNIQEVFERSTSQIRVIKQPNGKYRWFGIVGSSVLNRIGVFDSKQLFDDLINNFDPNNLPFTTMVHYGEMFNLGTVDKLERYNHLLLASGEFNDNLFATEIRQLIEKKPDYLGFSIGFWNNSETITKSKDNKLRAMYTKGKLKEISFLPEKYAAHPFTAILSNKIENEENRMLANELALRELLSNMGMDETRINDIVQGANTANRAIEENQLEVRVKEQENELAVQDQTSENQEKASSTQEETKEITPPAPSPMEDFEIELSDELVRTIQSEIETNLSSKFDELQNRISALEALNTSLQSDISALQNRIKGVEVEDQERIQEIVQDLPKKAKSQIKVVTRARSLVDEASKKNPSLNTLPDTPTPDWANNISKATRQKSS